MPITSAKKYFLIGFLTIYNDSSDSSEEAEATNFFALSFLSDDEPVH
jgi:hypothetical protein